MHSAVKTLLYSQLVTYLGHLKMKKKKPPLRESSFLITIHGVRSSVANMANKEEKLSRLFYRTLGVFPRGSQKHATKCSELVLIEDFEDIVNLFDIKTSQNQLYQLFKVDASHFFC